MIVDKLTSEVTRSHCPTAAPLTMEDLQREYNYIMAEKLVRKLQQEGLISMDQMNNLSADNMRKYCPFLSELIA